MAIAGHWLSLSESWRAALTLVLVSVAVMGSPGPSTMAVTAVSAAFRIRRSLGFVSGAIAGTAGVLAAVATGVAALLLSMPGLASALTFASVVYIAYLALRIATAPPLSQQAADIPAPSFAAGFLLAVANPKAWIAIAAVFAGSTLAVVDKVAILGAMIVFIHIVWLIAGTSLAGLLRDPRHSRIANVLFGAILVGTTLLALVR
jgi:threonine/homoserine/homoserine lactone efflux protein